MRYILRGNSWKVSDSCEFPTDVSGFLPRRDAEERGCVCWVGWGGRFSATCQRISAFLRVTQRLTLFYSAVAGASQHVFVLVLHQLDQTVTSGSQILSGIEVRRVLGESLTDQARHRETAIAVDVDLADR